MASPLGRYFFGVAKFVERLGAGKIPPLKRQGKTPKVKGIYRFKLTVILLGASTECPAGEDLA
jgi:hypothetical protein